MICIEKLKLNFSANMPKFDQVLQPMATLLISTDNSALVSGCLLKIYSGNQHDHNEGCMREEQHILCASLSGKFYVLNETIQVISW
jgi:hypothetical protein